ncbi:MAG: immune inhibitor A [Bacteroidales bacterium]|nr:immune inhibitor A [Bacteroidales bacterium]
MYGEQDEKPKILSYTPEVGSGNDGFWPPIPRIIPLCQENMLQNILAARLAGKYADVDDTSPLTTSDLTGFFSFSIQRLGLIDSTDFTVSIQPLGTEITEIGEPVVFSNLELLENDDDSISYSLDPSIQIGQEIKYLLSVDNDDFIVSDTITKIFGEAVIIFEDDGNTITNWSGGWGISNDQYHSPTGSITDSPYGNYNNNQTNSTTLTQEIDLTNSVFAVLNFWAIWEIEAGWDYVQVKISTNGGSSWEPLSGKYTKPGNNNQASGEPLYDGFQTSWVKEEMNLQDYLGETVKFRFTLKSDTWVTENGFHFDDLTVSVIDVFTSVDDLSGTPDITISNPIPNPANSTVRFNYLIPEKMDDAKLAIYNSAGQQTGVYDLKKNHNNIIISVADWNPGIYYYSIISSESRIKTKKLIVI